MVCVVMVLGVLGSFFALSFALNGVLMSGSMYVCVSICGCSVVD